MLSFGMVNSQTIMPNGAMSGEITNVAPNGANYDVTINVSDFTGISNGNDVDTEWVIWNIKSNGCTRYPVLSATTFPSQILATISDPDGGGTTGLGFIALLNESDICERGFFVSSGGQFPLQSINQCIGDYYADGCGKCCNMAVGSIVVDDDPNYFINNCVGGEREYYDIYAHNKVSTPCTDNSIPTWTITNSSGAANVSVSTVGIVGLDPSFGTGFVEGIATCDDGAMDTWRVDFTCLSPTQCDPDSVFYLNETVDCLAGTVEICMVVCQEVAEIGYIGASIGYDPTALQYISGNAVLFGSGVSNPSGTHVNFVHANGSVPGITIAAGSTMFCAQFSIIGDISNGTTFEPAYTGTSTVNEYSIRPSSGIDQFIPFAVVPNSIKCQ